MQRSYWRVLALALLLGGLFASCQEPRKVVELEEQLAKMTDERNKLSTENDYFRAQIDRLKNENEALKAQLAQR